MKETSEGGELRSGWVIQVCMAARMGDPPLVGVYSDDGAESWTVEVEVIMGL